MNFETVRHLLGCFVGKDDVRVYLRHIMDGGDYAYATDGYCAVRFPMTADLGAEKPDDHVIDRLRNLFAKHRIDQLIPLPTIAPSDLVDCGACHGTGKAYRCDECDDASGEFTYGSHTYECQHCEGTGQIEDRPFGSTDKPETCNQCKGVGKIGTQSVLIGDSAFAYSNIARMQKLPGIQIAVCGDQPAYFTFDGGGEGIVLPMKM